jgi:hypothetical protein
VVTVIPHGSLVILMAADVGPYQVALGSWNRP